MTFMLPMWCFIGNQAVIKTNEEYGVLELGW